MRAPRETCRTLHVVRKQLQDKFCERYPELKQLEQWRSKVGAFGVTGDAQLNPIENLRYVGTTAVRK